MTKLPPLEYLLQRDISDSKNKKNKINLYTVENLKNKPLYVYGYGKGYITLKIFLLEKYKLTLKGILDQTFERDTFQTEGKFFNPIGFRIPLEEVENAIVIISVGNSTLQKQIKVKLMEIGFKKIITAFEIYEYHLSHESCNFSESPMSVLIEKEKVISRVWELWADNKSKSIYSKLLQIYAGLPTPLIDSDPLEEQYFPKDVPLLKDKSRFINCGSFDGDTVRQLIKINGPIEYLACFEPDLENYKKLTSYISSNLNMIAKQILILPCAVYNKNMLLNFDMGNNSNSSVSETGDSFIQCVSIDSIMPNFGPTYMNMDVEGCELEAIHGASHTIKRYKPDLAICVYHKVDHLWRLPLLISSMSSDYRFYLRNYTGYPAETVLYCTQ